MENVPRKNSFPPKCHTASILQTLRPHVMKPKLNKGAKQALIWKCWVQKTRFVLFTIRTPKKRFSGVSYSHFLYIWKITAESPSVWNYTRKNKVYGTTFWHLFFFSMYKKAPRVLNIHTVLQIIIKPYIYIHTYRVHTVHVFFSFLKLWNVQEFFGQAMTVRMSTERWGAAVPLIATRGRCCLLLVLLFLCLLREKALKRLCSWNECHSQACTLREWERWMCYWYGPHFQRHKA